MGCSFASWENPSNHLLRYYPEEDQDLRGRSRPFVMELPAYHWPTVGTVLPQHGSVAGPSSRRQVPSSFCPPSLYGFTTYFGFTEDGFRMLAEDEIDMSILGKIGQCLAWIFIPQGFGNWQATVASITGLVAKENIVGTMGISTAQAKVNLYMLTWQLTSPQQAIYAFLAFNLLCAPCFAAMGAIKREMNNTRWFWIAVGYQWSGIRGIPVYIRSVR